MVRKLTVVCVLVFSVVFSACSSIFVKEKPGYIKVNSTRFELNGKPYYFLGTNLWYGCYIGSKGKTGDRERLIKELDLLKSLNVTNLRILAASEESDIKNSVKPGIQYAAGKYDQDLLDGLDFLLWEMGKRGMHGVLYLTNYWEWSGGMSQYNAWINGKLIDPAVSGDWHGFMQYSASFYVNEKANELYREYIKQLINRKNKYTRILYKDDTAIMAWQLANEPRPGDANIEEDSVRFIKWVDETAGYIHSLDPNHLVTTGNEGLAGSLQSEVIYLKAHQSKNIDYVTFHLWPKNWGWFDAKKIDVTYSRTEKNSLEYIAKHISYAKMLNKPTTLEEFGMARDNELLTDGTPVFARNKFYNAVFKIIYDSAAAGAPIAGSNFWGWGGYGRGKNSDGHYREGDPFVGDPLQEPQGLNSVFNTDTTTLHIISGYAGKMEELELKEKSRISSK